MAKKKNDYDEFDGVSLGGLGKYGERDSDTKRRERAAALDESILDALRGKHDVAWAKGALDFCDRVEAECRELADVSAEASRLDSIRSEAKAVIAKDEKDKKDRAAAAKRAIAEKASDADRLIESLNTAPRSKYWVEEVRDVDKEVASLSRESKLLMKSLPILDRLMKEADYIMEADRQDTVIHNLRTAPSRDFEWAQKVLKAANAITLDVIPYMEEGKQIASLKGAAEEITRKKRTSDKKKEDDAAFAARAKVEKPLVKPYERYLEKYSASGFDRSEDELPDSDEVELYNTLVEEYEKLDKGLSALKFDISDYIHNFDSEWAEIGLGITKMRALLSGDRKRREKNAREKARRVKAAEFERLLTEVEREEFDYAIKKFPSMNTELDKLDFRIDDYIDNFNKRWSAARSAIDAEKKRLNLIKQKQKEAEEAAEAEEIAKREALEKKRCRKPGIVSLTLTAIILGVLSVSAVLFHKLAPWLLGSAIGVLLYAVPSFVIPALSRKPAPDALLIISKSVAAVVAVVFMFIDVRYSLPIALTLVLTALEFAFDSFIDKAKITRSRFLDFSTMGYLTIKLLFLTVGLILSFISVGLMLSGTAKYLVIAIGGAASFALGGILMSCIDTDNECDVRATVVAVLSCAVTVTAIVFAFISRSFAMMSIPVAASAILVAIIAIIKNDDEAFAPGLTGAISAGVTLALSFFLIFTWYGTKDFVIKDNVLVACYARDQEVVEIPEGITEIGKKAFSKLSLRDWSGAKANKVILPSTCTTIGKKAFQKSSFTEVLLNDGLKTIGDFAFYEAAVQNIVIPDSVTSLGASTFTWSSLRSATVGSGVKILPEYAFSSCHALSEMKLSEGLETISKFAFEFDEKLTAIELPSTLKTLGTYAFSGACFTTLVIPDSVTTLSESAFSQCDELYSITLGTGITITPDSLFRGCNNLTEVTFKSVTVLKTSTFYNCDKLVTVNLPANLERIEKKAFNSCKQYITVNYAGTADEWNAVNKDAEWNVGNGGVDVRTAEQ